MNDVGQRDFDVIVIGSGPGGEGAAMQLAKGGKRVAIIERYDLVGGGCTHWGTIPSKALRFAIYQYTEAMQNPVFGSNQIKTPSITQLRASARTIIEKQVAMRAGFYSRNSVEVINGHAKFTDGNTLLVGDERKVTADHFVIAVGSRPYRPDSVDFSHPCIYDSDSILGIDDKPGSLTVYGAGVIGCEYTSMFRNLKIKINLVNSRNRLLDFLDDEISDALSYHMRDRGVAIRHQESFERIEGIENGVVLYLKSGKQIKSDALLWAVGRTGNTHDLGIENVGLEADSRGYLKVDSCFRTQVENVYAVGDVVGIPSLASAAYTQGRTAGNHILGNQKDFCQLSAEIPTGIYTSPEISSIGKNEKQLTEQKVPYEIGVSQFKQLAKAQITGQTVGMLKLLFHRESLEVLGVHCFGANASEIIHIGQAVMSQEGPSNSLRYFMNSTFNYPTMAEAYRVAALNGYNRLF